MPPSDALSGLDGTQLPDPLPTLPDPLAGPEQSTWHTSEFPPFVLPPLPDASAIREAIAAALGDNYGDTAPAADQDLDPAPAPQATEQPDAPQPNVGVPPPSATSSGEPAAPPTPPAGAPAGGSSRTGGEERSSTHRPQMTAPIPATPSQPRRTGGGLRYRPAKGTAAREPVSPADLRRRIRGQRGGLSLRTSSDGGATAVFLVMSIIVLLMLYFIITGFIASISSFFQ